jgi:hypothetical protein
MSPRAIVTLFAAPREKLLRGPMAAPLAITRPLSRGGERVKLAADPQS